ncbi:MAG: hypothetical protein LUG96_08405 [Tannerellaceae bacterium]|nr:hypothetical protein [Tannerellaceae bacterium]
MRNNQRVKKVIENLFGRIYENGELQIRTGLMQYIVDNANDKSETELVLMLYDFGNHIEHAEIDDSLKLKILFYVGYYVQLIYNKLGIRSYDGGG